MTDDQHAGPPAGRADQRKSAETALVAPGRRRRSALARLRESDAELKPLVIAAHIAGVSYVSITTRTGLAPSTLQRWLHRAT